MRVPWHEQLRRFYSDHRQEMYTYCLSLTRDTNLAEDAVHAAFERLLRRRRPPRELRPYVFRALRNAAIDLHRRVARDTTGASASIFSPNGAVPPEYPNLVQDALNTLSEDERETIVLKLYSGLTFGEIARTRRVSLNTAASWYRRGLAKLRDTLEEPSHE